MLHIRLYVHYTKVINPKYPAQLAVAIWPPGGSMTYIYIYSCFVYVHFVVSRRSLAQTPERKPPGNSSTKEGGVAMACAVTSGLLAPPKPLSMSGPRSSVMRSPAPTAATVRPVHAPPIRPHRRRGHFRLPQLPRRARGMRGVNVDRSAPTLRHAELTPSVAVRPPCK